MNYSTINYSMNTKSLDIFLCGCLGVNGEHCLGCHNPRLWNPTFGKDISTIYSEINKYIKSFDHIIYNIFIMGGEPLDLGEYQLIDLMKQLKSKYHKKIWLFTRREFQNINPLILQYLDYVKCGPYIKEQKSDNNIQYGIKLASDNQYIVKVYGD